MQRARLIYNPIAGRELVERRLPRLLECLEDAGYETSCRATKTRWDAAKEARLAVERKFDVIVAAGGDGTLHEVVNGIADCPHPPKLGIIPAGTTNDFARALGLPKDLYQACEVIAKGYTRKVDIGKWGDRYFLNVAAAGSITEVSFEAPSRLKTLVGPLAYYAKAIEKIGSLHKPFPVTFKTQTGEMELEVLLFIIANSETVAGFEKLAPAACFDDGLFDVLIVPKTKIPDLIQIAALAYQGKHVHDSRVIYFQSDQLQVTTPESIKLNLDGEWGGECNGTFEILPRHLEVFCEEKVGEVKE